jgi:anti-sigma B factor antagonist
MERHLDGQTKEGVLVLTLRDQQLRTEADCTALRQEFLDALQLAGAKNIIVDFRNVQYITSAAYRPLLALRRASHDAGVRLVLCNLAKEVASVFYVSRLITRDLPDESPFEEQPDTAAALAYLKRGSA